MDNQQRAVLKLAGWARTNYPHCKKLVHYEMLIQGFEIAGFCEDGNKPSGYIRDGEFLD
jgi:hypothetical protein